MRWFINGSMHCGDLWWDGTQCYICKIDTYCTLVTCAGMVHAGILKHCRVVVTPIKVSLHDDDEMMLVMMILMVMMVTIRVVVTLIKVSHNDDDEDDNDGGDEDGGDTDQGES